MAQYRNETYILVDYGLYHICNNLDEVTYGDVFEMRKYLGNNSPLEGKTYLYYCTDSGREQHLDEALGITDFTGADSDYDALLSNVQTYIDDKENIYFGMNDQQKINHGKYLIDGAITGRLRVTDALMIDDSPIDSAQRASLIDYRSRLRTLRSKTLTTVDSAVNPTFPAVNDSDLFQSLDAEYSGFADL